MVDSTCVLPGEIPVDKSGNRPIRPDFVARYFHLIGKQLFAMLLCLGSFLYIENAIAQQSYFLDREPFIHPRIIEDLTPLLSDSGEQVIAINLDESATTNRYFGDIKVNGKTTPFVYYEDNDICNDTPCPMGPAFFGYKLIGKTVSGIYVLFTEQSGGGSGRFRNLLLVSIEQDNGLTHYRPGTTRLRLDRTRRIIKRLGLIRLGDRYQGDLTVNGNILTIGKDTYSHSAGFFKEDVIIEFDSPRQAGKTQY